MEYKPNTVYKAVANTSTSCYRVYFMFSSSQMGGKCVSVGERLGEKWSTYHIETATDVYHTCNEGTWMLYFPYGYGCYPTWSFRRWGVSHSHEATISLANEEPAFKGKHYDVLIMDDMPMSSKSSSPEDVKRANKWYEYTCGRNTENQGSIVSKEVKKKMYLQAIDVIFFDRKTKKVAYREIVVAHDTEGAFMLAAQDFGKYDPKVHVKYAHCLFGFNEQNAEDDKEEN